MRTLSAIAFVAVTSCLGLETAHARATSGVSFGPQVGVSKSPGKDANLIAGAALRLRLIPVIGVDASINYHQEEFAGDGLVVRSWPVQVTGLLYVLPVAYAAMGAGWYMTTFDVEGAPGVVLEDDTETDFGWHFGGGLEIPLGYTAKLVGDLRYVFIDYDFAAVPGSGEVNSDFYMATAGLLFNF
jgi:hypothetical protein